MTRNSMTPARVALGLMGIGALAACTSSIAATNPITETDGPLTCSIEQKAAGSMVRLDAVVSADADISGEYRFTVRGNGTNINQGGPFMATPSGDTKVGVIQLSKGAYTVKLDVDAGSRSVTCEDTIRLSI